MRGASASDLAADARVVAVFGALAGARSLNELAVSAWGASGPSVLHICGERDFDALRPRVERDDYVLLPQTDHFGAALAAADLAVSRAGGTVWELAAAGTPAILVPYPHATADHQTLNARHFERGGGALLVPDAEVDRVPALVDELLADPERLAAMRDAMLALARPDAAEVIADELVALAEARSVTTEPLEGRRLYFVGIAGSGMSAYANVARALGAEVRGWDAHETIFSETLDGIDVDLGGEPRPPDGFEVIVSTAHRDLIAGTARAPRSSRSSSRRGPRSSSRARTARRPPPR